MNRNISTQTNDSLHPKKLTYTLTQFGGPKFGLMSQRVRVVSVAEELVTLPIILHPANIVPGAKIQHIHNRKHQENSLFYTRSQPGHPTVETGMTVQSVVGMPCRCTIVTCS
jgi:hypothetical protein